MGSGELETHFAARVGDSSLRRAGFIRSRTYAARKSGLTGCKILILELKSGWWIELINLSLKKSRNLAYNKKRGSSKTMAPLKKQEKIAEILLVENNPGDVRLMQESLGHGRVRSRLHTIGDGEEALAFLRQSGKYLHSVRPDIILLDLNLPCKNGQEVLAEIKRSPHLGSIPVVVWTTSDSEQDIRSTYELHANCYITKPVDFDQYLRVVRMIEDFWLTIARLPS
jgi:CheY-like chemotaxis protein